MHKWKVGSLNRPRTRQLAPRELEKVKIINCTYQLPRVRTRPNIMARQRTSAHPQMLGNVKDFKRELMYSRVGFISIRLAMAT